MIIIVILFLLLGPLVGGISFFWILSLLPLFSGDPDPDSDLLVATLLGAVGYPVSLSIGGIPAVVTALFYWRILKKHTVKNLTPGKRVLVGMGVGFVVTTLFALMAGMVLEIPSLDGEALLPMAPTDGMAATDESEEAGWIMLSLPGAMASAVCALSVSDRLYGWLFRNRSTTI